VEFCAVRQSALLQNKRTSSDVARKIRAFVSSSRVFLAHVGFKIRLLRTRTQLGAQLERRRSVGGASVWHLRLTPLFELSKNVGIQNDPDGVRVNISQRLANFKV